MAARACGVCGASLEGMHHARVYCSEACRQRKHRGWVAALPKPEVSRVWRDVVEAELARYDGVKALTRVSLQETARWLDEGGVSRSEWLKLRALLFHELQVLADEVAATDDPAARAKRSVALKMAELAGLRVVEGGN